jgi:hypothetical protein
MLTLYGMDCKSFLDLFSGKGAAEKRIEKGVTVRVSFTPCNPPVAPFYHRTSLM